MRGDFISSIFDSAEEIWQILGDLQIATLIKELTAKQREALFLFAVRFCTTEQIACYTDKTDRAVRRLISAALEYIREAVAEKIRNRILAGLPVTSKKLQFLEWYEQQKESPDDKSGEKTELL